MQTAPRVFFFYFIHNTLTAITILTLLTYNTNNAYYANNIYNVQNQKVYTHTKRKKERKKENTAYMAALVQREDKNQSGMSYSFRPSTLQRKRHRCLNSLKFNSLLFSFWQ